MKVFAQFLQLRALIMKICVKRDDAIYVAPRLGASEIWHMELTNRARDRPNVAPLDFSSSRETDA